MRQGGKNRRDLGLGLSLAAGSVALLILATDWIEGSRFAQGQELMPPRPLPAIVLQSADGRDLTLNRWHGKWLLLYCGYTYCPDICPAALSNLAQTLFRLGPPGRHLQVVFISLDAARDTPAMADRFARYFHPAFIGVTTTEPQATQLIHAAGTPFPFASDTTAGARPDPTQHPAQYFLADPAGRLVAKYGDDVAPTDLARDLRAVLGD